MVRLRLCRAPVSVQDIPVRRPRDSHRVNAGGACCRRLPAPAFTASFPLSCCRLRTSPRHDLGGIGRSNHTALVHGYFMKPKITFTSTVSHC